MKTNKPKTALKVAKKKTVKKDIEKSLTDKFLTAVKELGHNAEHIAEDIAKASKTVAKKLAKQMGKVKDVVEHKIEDVRHGSPDIKQGRTKKTKNPKVAKTVTKAVKKAVKSSKPAASVKVEGINSVEKAEAAINKPKAKATTKPPTMKNKNPDAKAGDSAKSVIKAVTNNPVEKVAKTAIPPQPKPRRGRPAKK